MHGRLDHGQVRLLTRTGLDWSEKYPATISTRQAYKPANEERTSAHRCRPGNASLPPATRVRNPREGNLRIRLKRPRRQRQSPRRCEQQSDLPALPSRLLLVLGVSGRFVQNSRLSCPIGGADAESRHSRRQSRFGAVLEQVSESLNRPEMRGHAAFSKATVCRRFPR
jgi:hypothetical protein